MLGRIFPCAALLFFVAIGCSAATPLHARLLTRDEVSAAAKTLDARQVPGLKGSLHIQAAQAFAIEGDAALQFAPVSFDSTSDDVPAPEVRCGIFVTVGGHGPTFLATTGYGWTEAVSCRSLDGVGFVASARPGVLPRILLLYSAASPNASVQEPFVVDWNEKRKAYELNEKLSRRLEDDAGATSILAIKRILKASEQKSGAY